jgi:hypothetical protein
MNTSTYEIEIQLAIYFIQNFIHLTNFFMQN